MVLILFLCGTRCFGAADYFSIEDEMFFVHTMFYHFWFIPLCPLESFVSKLSDDCGCFTTCNRGYVARLEEVENRTVLWAWVRCLTFLLSVVPMVLALVLYFPPPCEAWKGGPCPQNTPVLFIVLLTVGGCLFFLWPLSLIYKPKASLERKEKYKQIIASAVAAATTARQNVPQESQTAGPRSMPQAAKIPQPNTQQAARIVTRQNNYRPLTDDAAVV